MWNCTELDRFAREVHQVALVGDVGVVVLVGTLVVLGGLLLTAGERLARPLGAVVGGVGGTVATFVVTAMFDMSCESRLIASAIVGVLTAAVALLVLKTGIFLLGAGGLGAVTHLVYDSLPQSATAHGDGFALLGRSGYYYIAMASAVVVGGVVSYCQRKNVLRIASSLIGASAWTMALVVACDRASVSLPQLASLALLMTFTLLGVWFQRWRATRRDPHPPVGIPVA